MADRKYVSHTMPLSGEKYETLDEYRQLLQARFGFKVSLSDAAVHAVKLAMEAEARNKTPDPNAR